MKKLIFMSLLLLGCNARKFTEQVIPKSMLEQKIERVEISKSQDTIIIGSVATFDIKVIPKDTTMNDSIFYIKNQIYSLLGVSNGELWVRDTSLLVEDVPIANYQFRFNKKATFVYKPYNVGINKVKIEVSNSFGAFVKSIIFHVQNAEPLVELWWVNKNDTARTLKKLKNFTFVQGDDYSMSYYQMTENNTAYFPRLIVLSENPNKKYTIKYRLDERVKAYDMIIRNSGTYGNFNINNTTIESTYLYQPNKSIGTDLYFYPSYQEPFNNVLYTHPTSYSNEYYNTEITNPLYNLYIDIYNDKNKIVKQDTLKYRVFGRNYSYTLGSRTWIWTYDQLGNEVNLGSNKITIKWDNPNL